MQMRQPIKFQALQKLLKRRERMVRFGDEFDTGDRKKRFKPFVLEKRIGIDKDAVALARPSASWRCSQPCTHAGDMRQCSLEDNDDVQRGTPAGDGVEFAGVEGKCGVFGTIQARSERPQGVAAAC